MPTYGVILKRPAVLTKITTGPAVLTIEAQSEYQACVLAQQQAYTIDVAAGYPAVFTPEQYGILAVLPKTKEPQT